MDTLTERSIALLRRDGRASFSDLARQLDTNRMSVAKRLNPLLESGALNVFAAVHPRLLGLNVLAHLSLRVSGPTRGLAEQLAALGSPVFVSETAGAFQLVAELHAETMAELQADIRRVRAMPGVSEVHVLLYERMLSSFFLGEEPSLFRHSLDDQDLQLMEHLQRDGRIGYSELGAAVGLSTSACRVRVARLLSSGAMQIGVVRGRSSESSELVFGFGVCLSGDEAGLVALLQEQPGTEFVARTVGRFDLVATVAFTSQQAYLALSDALRELPTVSSTESWMHARISLERYHHSAQRLVRANGAAAPSA